MKGKGSIYQQIIMLILLTFFFTVFVLILLFKYTQSSILAFAWSEQDHLYVT